MAKNHKINNNRKGKEVLEISSCNSFFFFFSPYSLLSIHRARPDFQSHSVVSFLNGLFSPLSGLLEVFYPNLPCFHLVMQVPLSVETLFLQEAWMDRRGDSFTQDGEGYLLHVISSLAY